MEEDVMKTNYTLVILTLVILTLAILVMIPISSLLATSSDENCIDIDCLKERLKQICREGVAPSYLNCNNILRCIDGGEQKVMKCAKGYSAADGYHEQLLDDDWIV